MQFLMPEAVPVHFRNKTHMYALEIRRLVEQGATTYTEIGKHLGTRRVKISRIASAIGVKLCKTRRCECGFLLSRTTHSKHRKSIAHVQGKRVRRLLEQDCLTFAEIGRRLRLSRERVRQIAYKLGAKGGRERQRSCKSQRNSRSENA